MSCGCFGVPGEGTEYQKIVEDAKKRAQEEGETMAIWQERQGEGFVWCVGPANWAAAAGKSIRQVFSGN